MVGFFLGTRIHQWNSYPEHSCCPGTLTTAHQTPHIKRVDFNPEDKHANPRAPENSRQSESFRKFRIIVLSEGFCVPASFLHPFPHPTRILARLRPIFRPQQLYDSRDDAAQGQTDHFSRHFGGGAPSDRFARRLRRRRGASAFRHPFRIRSCIRLASLA